MIKNNARLRTRGVTPVLALVMTCLPWVSAVAIDEHANGTSMVASALSGPVRDVYHRLPLHFEANQGQTDKQVDFVAHGSGYTLFVTPTEAVWAFHNQPSSRISRQTNPQKPQQSTGAVLRMRLVG